jgi:DNA-binding transcriptional ArsR family regulator
MGVRAMDPEAMRASAEHACALMKALSNPDRLLLLCHLSQGEKCVGELEAQSGIVQPTLSQQLAVLREQSLVRTRREGKNIFYAVDSPQALALLKTLYRQYC